MGKGRAPCCDKTKVRIGPWSPAEDLRLINFIQKNGHPNWRALPKQAGLLRCGKSCRLRWINYLRPDVKRGNFTPQEEETIIQLHNSFGNKWSKIASCLPGRTDNEIKNVWNTHLKKRSSKTDSSNSITLDENAENFIIGDDDQLQKDENPHFIKDDPKSHEATFQMDISWELDDVNLWEIWESLDPLLESNYTTSHDNNNNNNNNIEEEKSDGELVDELDKWLRCIENELGLTSCRDDDVGRST